MNNAAEYAGLIAGLAHAATITDVLALIVEGDSELVVNQVIGTYKTNAASLVDLRTEARGLSRHFTARFEIRQIPREENAVADALANEVIRKKSDFLRPIAPPLRCLFLPLLQNLHLFRQIPLLVHRSLRR
jgi:ribonuclease HI